MLIRTLSSVSESISIPTQVRILLSAIPNVDVRLIDYDYIGNAKEADFASFANQLYPLVSHFRLMLVTFSKEMKDSKLLRKKFDFNISGYKFALPFRTVCVSLQGNLVAFSGSMKLDSYNDFIESIKFLFSGVYESQNFLLCLNHDIIESEIDMWVEKSLELCINRHNSPQGVKISLEKLYTFKDGNKIMYPYGGSDFGSFMLFEF